jgi:hypothetical protein
MTPQAPAHTERYWLQIISQMGGDVAMHLSAVQAHLEALGPNLPPSSELQKLQERLARVRQIGMLGQQLARMAAGEVHQVPEEISLTTVLREVLAQQKARATLRGVELHRAMHPATVLLDPSLLHSFVQQLTDWALALAQDQLDIRLELHDWPPQARLQLTASHPQPPEAPASSDQLLAWSLIEQMARAQHLRLERLDRPDATQLVIDFPQTLSPETAFGVGDDDPDHLSSAFALSQASRPLAGSHWLVIAGQRDVRTEVREALRASGMLVDFVGSVQEAAAFCQDSTPHGILFEAILGGERVDRLRHRLSARAPHLVWVEMAAEGLHALPGEPALGRPARIGRDALSGQLVALLESEYTRHL